MAPAKERINRKNTRKRENRGQGEVIKDNDTKKTEEKKERGRMEKSERGQEKRKIKMNGMWKNKMNGGRGGGENIYDRREEYARKKEDRLVASQWMGHRWREEG